MKLIKANRRVFFIIICVVIFCVSIVVGYFLATQENSEIRVKKNVGIPPEFFHGKTIRLGDSYDKINSYEKLLPVYYEMPLIGLMEEDCIYRGSSVLGTVRFNEDEELASLEIYVRSKDSLNPNILFINTAKTMLRHYGRPKAIYLRYRDSSEKILYWETSEQENICMTGYYVNTDIHPIDENIVKKNNFVLIRYNMGLSKTFFIESKNESLQSLGIQ